MKIKINNLNCQRCGHTWVPKIENVKVCPKCKSPYWDKPRRTKNEHISIKDELKNDSESL